MSATERLLVTLERLTDAELEAEVLRLATCERRATAALVAHLAELQARRIHERAGFSSLFTYCLEVLRLSEHEAYDRMKAARVARRHPPVLGWLASGELNLTTVRLLAPHLTRRNQDALFAAARGKRKRQVQEMLAARFPRPDVPSSVRRLPRPTVAPVVPTASAGPLAAPGLLGDAATPSVDPSGPPATAISTKAMDAPSTPARIAIPAPPPPLVEPLSPDRYRITFTANGETRELLERARDLLRHSIPSGDPAQIFARALDSLVRELLKKKFGIRRPEARGGAVTDVVSGRTKSVEADRPLLFRERVHRDAFRSGTTAAPTSPRRPASAGNGRQSDSSP